MYITHGELSDPRPHPASLAQLGARLGWAMEPPSAELQREALTGWLDRHTCVQKSAAHTNPRADRPPHAAWWRRGGRGRSARVCHACAALRVALPVIAARALRGGEGGQEGYPGAGALSSLCLDIHTSKLQYQCNACWEKQY